MHLRVNNAQTVPRERYKILSKDYISHYLPIFNDYLIRRKKPLFYLKIPARIFYEHSPAKKYASHLNEPSKHTCNNMKYP